ncbi:HU family DNA-binding protein [Paracoccus mangrovi]|uniref:HU family DNA-binding protein n=1 Tax=Paracoccus mangrovi TaxID=1715645 RepID=A0ABV7R8K3_9RHOB
MAKTKGGGTDPPQDPHNAKVLQKRQLLAQVVRRTGLRSADIKPVVEATLAELGNAIAAGMTLALPPLGRARVRHSIDRSGAEIVTLRLRRRPDAEPLGDG